METLERIVALETKQDVLLKQFSDHMDAEERDRKTLIDMFKRQEKRLDDIEKNISTAKTVVRTLKTLGAVLILILTLKFGDLAKQIKGIFQ